MQETQQSHSSSTNKLSPAFFLSHLVLHLVVNCQVPLHLCPKGGSVSTVWTDHVAPFPLLTVLDVVPQRGSSLVHSVAERTSLLGFACTWRPERGEILNLRSTYNARQVTTYLNYTCAEFLLKYFRHHIRTGDLTITFSCTCTCVIAKQNINYYPKICGNSKQNSEDLSSECIDTKSYGKHRSTRMWFSCGAN